MRPLVPVRGNLERGGWQNGRDSSLSIVQGEGLFLFKKWSMKKKKWVGDTDFRGERK